MLCVAAFVLLACVVVPVAAVTILAVSARKNVAMKPGPHFRAPREDGPRPDSPGLSLPPANGVR